MGDHSGVYRLHIRPHHPKQLSLAIPPWIDEMNIKNDKDHCWTRNDKFYITVGSFTRTVDLLIQLVKGR